MLAAAAPPTEIPTMAPVVREEEEDEVGTGLGIMMMLGPVELDWVVIGLLTAVLGFTEPAVLEDGTMSTS